MSEVLTSPKLRYPVVEIGAAASFIQRLQKPTGEIPWSEGGKTDPWDHVESAMGLSVAGYLQEAEHSAERRQLVVRPPGRSS